MAQFPEIYTEQAKIFKAIGHPARLMMVEALLEGPKTVSELTAIVQLEMPTVSRHLNCLKEAQVVKSEKKRKLYYLFRGTDLPKKFPPLL